MHTTLHLGFAFQPLEIGLQGELGAAQDHVIDLVMSQVTQRGGVAAAAGEEVLVDAQHLRAAPRVPLAELVLQSVAEVALHGGRADGFPPSQSAAVDAVQMLAEDHSLEGFAGALARLDTGKALAEVAAATLALPLATLATARRTAAAPSSHAAPDEDSCLCSAARHCRSAGTKSARYTAPKSDPTTAFPLNPVI